MRRRATVVDDTRTGGMVTGLSQDPRMPGSVIVEVDGERFASLPVETVRDIAVGVGVRIEGEGWKELRRAADAEAAYRVAMRLLANRPRSVREIGRCLRDRGHPPEAAATAVARLQEHGWLDDAEFARHFVRTRSARGHGAPRLSADLQARGVDRGVAERAVRETLDAEGVSQADQVSMLAEKRLHQLAHQPPAVRRRRVLAYLARRGFHGWEIRQVVERLLAGHESS